MFIEIIIYVLLAILIHIIYKRFFCNSENFVPVKLSTNNYQDIFIKKEEDVKYNNKNSFEENLKDLYYGEGEDIPINIIYDTLTEKNI